MEAAADRTTARMGASQLHDLLAPERETVILLTDIKRKDYLRSAFAIYCAVAIALFLVGLMIAL